MGFTNWLPVRARGRGVLAGRPSVCRCRLPRVSWGPPWEPRRCGAAAQCRAHVRVSAPATSQSFADAARHDSAGAHATGPCRVAPMHARGRHPGARRPPTGLAAGAASMANAMHSVLFRSYGCGAQSWRRQHSFLAASGSPLRLQLPWCGGANCGGLAVSGPMHRTSRSFLAKRAGKQGAGV